MLKLRKILLLNYVYYLALFITIIVSIPRLIIPKTSNYNENTKEMTGIVINYQYTKNTLKLTLKNKEKVIVYYYLKENSKIPNVKIGDKIKIKGEFNKPSKNTTENLFNYQKYLYNKNIHYIVNATSLKKISSTSNPYYKIKKFFINASSSNAYLKAFILGDKSELSKDVVTSYQENGISHLFAISGMHITLASSIILKLLKKLRIKEEKRYLITSLCLIFYLSLIGLSPSALRGVLFFILFSINKVYYFYIKAENIFISVLVITLLINPYFIYDIGFQYSFLISITLILMSSTITGNYLLKLLKTSFLSFIVSIPISLYNYFQINLLSIVYNLFYVPLVSYIIFPLSLLTFIFKPLLPVYNIFIKILENTSLFFNKITIGKLIFPRLNIIIYLIYILVIIIVLIYLKKHNKKPLLILIIILAIHYITPYLKNDSYIKMIDVGQGDSILIHSNNKSILIDTGGKIAYNDEQETSKIVTTTTVPLLKSLGIRKIDYLLLTHGDADHMGEAKFLLASFKVKTALINSGEINYLEEELLKKYPDKIQIAEEGRAITIGNISFVQLNETMSNENDSSQIYFATNGTTNILLTGDASIETEKLLLSKYNLPDIDILKVGHHGSKTSTSKELLQVTKPKLALISCGKDNKFSHPHEEVINKLKKYNVDFLITAEEGTITIDLNTLKIT